MKHQITPIASIGTAYVPVEAVQHHTVVSSGRNEPTDGGVLYSAVPLSHWYYLLGKKIFIAIIPVCPLYIFTTPDFIFQRIFL